MYGLFKLPRKNINVNYYNRCEEGGEFICVSFFAEKDVRIDTPVYPHQTPQEASSILDPRGAIRELRCSWSVSGSQDGGRRSEETRRDIEKHPEYSTLPFLFPSHIFMILTLKVKFHINTNTDLVSWSSVIDWLVSLLHVELRDGSDVCLFSFMPD